MYDLLNIFRMSRYRVKPHCERPQITSATP